jgi:hypothetical protein
LLAQALKLDQAGIRVSMDARGRWMNNAFTERLRRSHKQGCAYWQPSSRRHRRVDRHLQCTQAKLEPERYDPG